MSDRNEVLAKKLEEAQDKLKKAEKELADLKAKPVKEPVKRDFDIKRQKKEAEISELQRENRKTSSKLDELSAEKRELRKTLKQFQDLPINEEYSKELKFKKEAEKRWNDIKGATQSDKLKMRKIRRELAEAGFSNRDQGESFSYANEIDKRIYQLEENMENGVLGTAQMSRLQHEKYLQKEISSMKKFRSKGEEMDNLMKKVKDAKESTEFKQAEKENLARKDALGTLRDQREASRQEAQGVRNSLDDIRKHIDEAQKARTTRTEKMKKIQLESNEIRKQFRDFDTKYKEYYRKLNRAEQKVIQCQRLVEEALRDINQEEILKASVEEAEAQITAGSGNKPPSGRGGPKQNNSGNSAPKAEKPQPKTPSPPKPSKKKTKKVDKDDEKKEATSLVRTTVSRNMKEINEITALIAYLKSLMPKGDSSPTSQDKKTSKTGFGQEEGVAEDDPMAALFNSKPQPKKRKKRRKKVVKDLKHSMNYYKLFNSYDVDYPQKIEEVPDCLQALEKKLAEFQDDAKSSSNKAPAKAEAQTEAKAEAKVEATADAEEETNGDAAVAGGPANGA